MGYNWCSGSVLSATLCFQSASAILWSQPEAAAPNGTLKTNHFLSSSGQFIVPHAANLWVQSHNYEGPQGAGYNRWFHKPPLFHGSCRYCFLQGRVAQLYSRPFNASNPHSRPSYASTAHSAAPKVTLKTNDFLCPSGHFTGSVTPQGHAMRQIGWKLSCGFPFTESSIVVNRQLVSPILPQSRT